MSDVDLSVALEVARKAAVAASEAALAHFARGVTVERKADRSPVTAADRASEEAILSVITAAFPDHTILAEESGETPGHPRYRWIVDPIDGTRGFTRGGQFWGSLIALEIEGEVAVGTMALPALDDVYSAARGLGCWRNGDRVTIGSPGPSVSEATISLGEPKALFGPHWGPIVTSLIADAESTRCYGDLMGLALVLRNVADAWLEAGVQRWDIAPAPVLIEEAGGVFSSFRGDRNLDHGTVIAASTKLHAELVARFSPAT